jgi:hypothetical protein
MIKDKDLQIDNLLISTLTGEYVKADWLVIKHITDGNVQSVYDDRSVYEPIPLTEEILIKAGFNTFDHTCLHTGFNKCFVKIDQHKYPRSGFALDYYDGTFKLLYLAHQQDASNLKAPYTDECYNYVEREAELKYVHQLQNLYYALTGEELEINL